MTNETLKQLLANKTITDLQTEDRDFEHGLRLVLRDAETGEMGVLTVGPCQLVLPDEVVLDYSYQEITDRLAPSPEHFYQFDTLGRDDKRSVPFLEGKQSGLF